MGARSRRENRRCRANGGKVRQSAVHEHVATATQDHDVTRLIVTSVAVPMVPINTGLATFRTGGERVVALCAGALGFRSGAIATPLWMIGATQDAELSSVLSVGTISTLLPLPHIARLAQAANFYRSGLVATIGAHLTSGTLALIAGVTQTFGDDLLDWVRARAACVHSVILLHRMPRRKHAGCHRRLHGRVSA